MRTISLRSVQEMKGYRLYNVMPELVSFINELTNWYVRLNRDRLKGTAKGENAETGLQVRASGAGGGC